MLLPLFNYATFFSPLFFCLLPLLHTQVTFFPLSLLRPNGFFLSHNGRNNIIFDFLFKHERFLWVISSFTRFHLCTSCLAAVKLRVKKRKLFYVCLYVYVVISPLRLYSNLSTRCGRRLFKILSSVRHLVLSK